MTHCPQHPLGTIDSRQKGPVRRRIPVWVAGFPRQVDTFAKPAVDKQRLAQEAKDHPTVRTVLDILGGEVKDVKPRTASGD